ncbi:hypothetical protein [Neisseria sp. CCUG12390]|uniref:hypothetical protein n=1 Tax=Neisseria sp. CCUG12390 TaxID=3392035 RepID=UPI003A0FC3CC
MSHPILTVGLIGCLFILGGCIRVQQPYDFRPQTGLTPTAQPLPLRLDSIQTESRVSLVGVGSATSCLKPDCPDASLRLTQPLAQALQDTFANTGLFSRSAVRGVRLKAAFLGWETRGGVFNKSRVRIRYEFADSGSGKILWAEEIESMSWETAFNPIDMGQSYDDAVQQSVQNNIRKLLNRLKNPSVRNSFRVD